jgi:hypothetical protein
MVAFCSRNGQGGAEMSKLKLGFIIFGAVVIGAVVIDSQSPFLIRIWNNFHWAYQKKRLESIRDQCVRVSRTSDQMIDCMCARVDEVGMAGMDKTICFQLVAPLVRAEINQRTR